MQLLVISNMVAANDLVAPTATCCPIFWSVVVPTALYGSEVWCLKEKHVELLDKFQAFAGNHIQRLCTSTATTCGYFELGWLHLSTLVHVRKLLFLKTVIVMENSSIIKEVRIDSVNDFMKDISKNYDNSLDSPIFEIMKSAINLSILNTVMGLINGNTLLTECWKAVIRYLSGRFFIC